MSFTLLDMIFHICIHLQFWISHIYIYNISRPIYIALSHVTYRRMSHVTYRNESCPIYITFLVQFTLHSSHIFRWISCIYIWDLIVASWLIRIWDTHSHMWHDSFPYVTWLIPTCDMTHSDMGHDSFLYVTWLIRLCDVTHSHLWHDTFQYVNDSFPKVTWLIHKCGMIHSCVTWLICICDITHLLI